MHRNCVFCKIVERETPAAILWENDTILAFLDIAPLNHGHALVITKKHYQSLTMLSEPEHAALLHACARVGAALMRVVDADGFNVLLANGSCAGQVVQHVHLHVVPRHPVDGLVLPQRTVPYDNDAQRDEIATKTRQRLADASANEY